MDPHSFFADPDAALFLDAAPDPQPWFWVLLLKQNDKKNVYCRLGLIIKNIFVKG